MGNLLSLARKTKMYFRAKQGLKTPLVLIYFITNKCNMRCKHCFYWKELNSSKNSLPLQLDEIKKIACSFKEPLASLIITGGEPFLCLHEVPELTEICKIYYEKNHTRNFYLLTNGYLTEKIIENTELILKTLSPSTNLHLQVSLDGEEEIHDKIRNTKGSFQNAVNTLIALKSLSLKHPNLHIYILTVISKWNVKDLKALSDFAIYKLGLPITFELVRGSTLFPNNTLISQDYAPVTPEETLLSVSEMLDAYKIVKEIYAIQKTELKIDLNLSLLSLQKAIEIVKNNHKVVNCIAGNVAGVMYADGEVSGCELIKFNTNIREFELDFYKLWQSEKFKDFRKMVNNCYCTLGCFLQASLQNSLKYGLFYHSRP